MSTDIRVYRNGNLIDSPRNWKAFEIECNWQEESENASISITSLEFVGKEATNIRDRVLDGLIGGVGIFEGDSLEIEFGDAGNPVFKFEGYLDYAKETSFIGLNEVSVSLGKVQSLEWLSGVADGYSFASLYDEGIVTQNDFIKVPYKINYVPDNMQVLMLSISLFMMTKEAIQLVYSTAESTADLINSLTPSVGLGVVWDIGDVIWVALKIIFKVAYAIAIAYAIISLMKELIEQLFPKKRNHLGMSIKTMFERGCQKSNLTLNSQLLDSISNWVILPTKFFKGEEPPKGETETGFPLNGDPIYTFGDLIRICTKWFKAEYKIENGVFYFEKKNTFMNNSSYVIPATYIDQDKLQNISSFNTDELNSNYFISYNFDNQDQNTLDNQEGRIVQVITEPINVLNPKLKNMTGLYEVNIPISMGVEKTSYTKVEKIAKDILGGVDNLVNKLGGNSNLQSKIEDGLNTLLLSSHMTSMPKVVVMSGSKLANNQRSLLSAINLYNNSHYVDSFVETNGVHNQWKKFPETTIPFSKNDFVNLTNNNYCFDENGNKAKIETLKWTPYKGTAVITGRINEKYTNNLKTRIIV
jgi:hypothetical protein